MHCRHCGTKNPENVLFCKACGAGLRPGGRGPLPPARAGATPRVWWYWLGVAAILTPFFFFVDLLLGANHTVFLLGLMGVFFLVGALYFLLAATQEAYRKPLVVVTGGALLMTSVGALPFVALPLTESWTLVDAQETYSIPFDDEVRILRLEVLNQVGRVTVTTVDSLDSLAFVWVTVRGWGSQQEAVDRIDWSHGRVGNVATGELTLREPSDPGLFREVSYAVDIHVSASPILFFTLSSLSGSVSLDLGPGTGPGAMVLRTTSGSVNLHLDQSFLLPESRFVLQSSTGNIGIHLTNPFGAPAVVPFSAQTVLGNVDVTLDLGPGVGAEGIATSAVGSLLFDDTKYAVTSDAFSTLEAEAQTVLTMSLVTTSGNIYLG